MNYYDILFARKLGGSGGGGETNNIIYTTTAEFSELEAGKMTVITDSPATMSLVFSLSQPSETKKSEYVLIFKAGETTSVTITAPNGYVFNWADGEPTWTAGNLYEINFLSLEKAINENKVIGVLYKEYTEA